MKSRKKLIQGISTKINNGYPKKSLNYKFGSEYFGPFLYGYVSWFYTSIKNKEYTKIFFLSRDGYMMKKAFDILNVGNIVSEYVYFSRKSIRQALLNKCETYGAALKYLTKERYVSFAKFLEYFGFSEKERMNLSEVYNIELNREYKFSELKNDKELEMIYYDLKNTIDEYSIQQEILLEKYMKQIGMDDRCAIVDIGWHGSMQFYLEEFIREKNLSIMLEGYYVGIDPIADVQGETFGYLYDKNDLNLRKSVLCFLGVYERLFQSYEGSTCGYTETENYVIPELMKYEYIDDEQSIHYMKEWQNGAIKFVKEMLKENGISIDSKSWALPLIKVGKKPTNAQIKLFSFLYNMDGDKTYYVCQKPLYKYHLKEFMHDLSNSVWKTGFMKSAFKLPLPYYFIYKLIRK